MMPVRYSTVTTVMTNLYASVSTAKLALLVFYCITSKLKKFSARPFIRTLDTVAISSRNLPCYIVCLFYRKASSLSATCFGDSDCRTA